MRATRVRRASAVCAGAIAFGLAALGNGTGAAAGPPSILLGASIDATGTGALADVACPSASLCVAVGDDGAGHGAVVAIRQGVAQRAQVVTHLQYISGIACADAQHCVAVGGGATPGVVAINNGVARALQRVPAMAGVACPTASHCVAVGGNSIVDVVNGTVTHTSTTSRFHSLLGVSCIAATTCIVIGANPLPPGPRLFTTAFALMTNGVVGVAHAIRANQDVTFDHIRCAAKPICLVGGSMLGQEGFATTINAQTLSQGVVLDEFTLGSDELTTAACPLAQRCVFAAGPALVLTTRGSFQLAGGTSLPTPDERIDSLACVSASRCFGVGSRTDPNDPTVPVGWVQHFSVG